jgi:hypothetical protein
MKIFKIAQALEDEAIEQQQHKIELSKYGHVNWAVYLDGELLCVTVYKKGGLAVVEVLQKLLGNTPEGLTP